MADSPVQRSEAAPAQVGDPLMDAQAVLDDPSKANTPEWLAAKQLLAEQAGDKPGAGRFQELEKEMEAIRGMSEI